MNKEYACKILNIDINENIDERLLRTKYKKACLKNHPDKNLTGNACLFIETQEAYDFMLNNLTPLSPLYYLDEDITHGLFVLLKYYIYQPFEKHINSYAIYELNPTITKLFNKDVYYLQKYDLYIPLWHHELWFEDKRLKIKIVPTLPNYVYIDADNNIHINIEVKSKKIGELICISIHELSFSFIYDKKIMEDKMVILFNKGIPIIDNNNIYSYCNLTDVFIHLK